MLEYHKHHNPERLFDGIVDNRAAFVPKVAALLFYGLVLWGLVFMGYYLFSGWSSQAEFEAKMKAHQQSSASSPDAIR